MTGTGGTARPGALLLLAAATLSITLGALPVFLVGSLAVFIRDDLSFGETRLGAAASLYYLASAVCSVPGGRLCERLGARRSVAVAATGTMIASLGIAVLSQSWLELVLFLVLAGISNAIALPATNLAVARSVSPRRQGVAFGLKQSSGPFATLLAGAAVPLLGLTVGWRWAFVAAAAAAVPLIVVGVFQADQRPRPTLRHTGVTRTGPLVVLALGATCAVVAGSSLGAFYVQSAVTQGVPAGTAGTLFAAGSVLGVLARVGWGWIGDRRRSLHFAMVAGLLISGALGFALLGAADRIGLLAVATVLIFCTGWAWPGLFNFAVVDRTPAAPAAATGITGTGLFAGGIVGPLGFGGLVERTSYLAGWLTMAVAMVLAGVLIQIGGRWLQASGAAAGLPVEPGVAISLRQTSLHGKQSDEIYHA